MKQMADLLYLVPFVGEAAGREVLIALLMEAQSGPDQTMGFRLLRYEVRFWEQEERGWKSSPASGPLRLTPCVAVVFHSGEDTWNELPRVVDLMDVPEAITDYVPNPKALFLNLKKIPPEDLTARGGPLGWVLRVLQKATSSEEEVAAALAEAAAQLAALPETEEASWRRLMWFLLLFVHHRRPLAERRRLAGTVTAASQERRRQREVSAMGKTIADGLREEGMELAKRDDIIRVMMARFPQAPGSLAERVRSISDLAKLDDLLVKAATASRWEEIVFN